MTTRVATVDGRAVAIVTDVECETDSGVVVRVVTDHGPIEPDRLRSSVRMGSLWTKPLH